MHTAVKQKQTIQWLGFLLGPLLAAVLLWSLPSEFHSVGEDSTGSVVPFSWGGRATLAVMVWMGIWWLTEAVPISVTALLPIVAFPLLGAATITDACAPYADPLVFLYLGGFVIALSMQRWGLGHRIALLTLSKVGTSAGAMVGGFMFVTAGLSAFVSNTATTAMMLPIALSVTARLRTQAAPDDPDAQAAAKRFSTCLLLAIAYSASIGGVMTIIGTPTNAFLVGFLRDKIATEYRQDLTFFDWLPIGVSIAAIFLPLIYIVLTRVAFPVSGIAISGGRELVTRELRSLGRIGRGEGVTLVVFAFTVALWLSRSLLTKIEWTMRGETIRPLSELSDPVIAMIGAMLLFIIPIDLRQRKFTMDWDATDKMPWGILLLFGGGLSLAAAISAGGVAEYLGSLVSGFTTFPPVVIVLFVTIAVVFLTELTSNAATTASLVPVLAALAPGLGVHPYLLIFPATIASSCAFMLPVATPPNAIVFGSNAISIGQMVRAGFMLNLIAIVLVTLLAFWVVRPLLGV